MVDTRLAKPKECSEAEKKVLEERERNRRDLKRFLDTVQPDAGPSNAAVKERLEQHDRVSLSDSSGQPDSRSRTCIESKVNLTRSD